MQEDGALQMERDSDDRAERVRQEVVAGVLRRRVDQRNRMGADEE
jgi:hypothetical protein